MRKRLSRTQIENIISLVIASNLSFRKTAKLLELNKTTVAQIFHSFIGSDKNIHDINDLDDTSFYRVMGYPDKSVKIRTQTLYEHFPYIYKNLLGSSLLKEWRIYSSCTKNGYGYSQFCFHFNRWMLTNNLEKPQLIYLNLSTYDYEKLKKYKQSQNRSVWSKAKAMIDIQNGKSINEISDRMNKSPKTLKKWISTINNDSVDFLFKKTKYKINSSVLQKIEVKKNRVVEILHQPPSLFGVNRTSWDQYNLSQVYESLYKESISTSTVSEYLISRGYVFKKARKVLTSNDPLYREKLEKITNILQNLKHNEKFFSIDEYGPFAIKIQGGRSYTQGNEYKTFPQFQRSKGSLIFTAALELSTNQISYFYSKKKNTDEMIKLLHLLLKIYKNESKLYFSWDAASWHASKLLFEEVEHVNSDEYRKKNETPEVILAPLPARAQFLNVIESVFSGMARAIIHNSNYSSVSDCKTAINKYIESRNEHFQLNPHRAGNKIWGKERVPPHFEPSNSCKDPKYR